MNDTAVFLACLIGASCAVHGQSTYQDGRPAASLRMDAEACTIATGAGRRVYCDARYVGLFVYVSQMGDPPA